MNTFNIVILWKQNDLRLYNRRVDSMVSALDRNSRVRKIVCVSAPVSYDDMAELQERMSDPTSDSKLRYANIHQDYFGLREHGKCTYLNYIYSDYTASIFSGPLRRRSEYQYWLKEKLAELDVLENCILLVYPVVKDIEEVLQLNKWEYVIQDVVDDELKNKHDKKELRALYEKYLICNEHADLSIFSSTTRFKSYSRLLGDNKTFRIFPNDYDFSGSSFVTTEETGKKYYKNMMDVKRVIGYVGDFGNRIDYDLLQFITTEIEKKKDWKLMLVGPNIDKKYLKKIERSNNIHYVGPIRHQELRNLIPRFDVGIIPHLINETTDAMSPLKVFQYLQHNVPVVTTGVNNIPEGKGIYVSGTREEFISNLHSASFIMADNKYTYVNKWDEYIGNMLKLADASADVSKKICLSA